MLKRNWIVRWLKAGCKQGGEGRAYAPRHLMLATAATQRINIKLEYCTLLTKNYIVVRGAKNNGSSP